MSNPLMRTVPLLLFFIALTLNVTAQTPAGVKVLSAPQPAFPAGANNVIYGDVVDVQIKVDRYGKVKEAFAYGPLAPCSDLKDKTAAAIADAAVAAARSTTFEPIQKDGKPVEAGLTVTYKLPVQDPIARDETEKRKRLYIAKPDYNWRAKDAGVQGEVKLSVLIDEEGKVISVGPRSGHPFLLIGAIKPACEARYEPGASKAIGVLTYRFIWG